MYADSARWKDIIWLNLANVLEVNWKELRLAYTVMLILAKWSLLEATDTTQSA